jgi:hypothetical protein
MGKDKEMLWVNYHGLFGSPMSWAQVNREMVLALDRLGCRVTVMAYRGFGYDPEFPLEERIRSLRSGPRSQEWDVAFEYPLNYDRLQARRKAGLLVYETTELPPHWARAIQAPSLGPGHSGTPGSSRGPQLLLQTRSRKKRHSPGPNPSDSLCLRPFAVLPLQEGHLQEESPGRPIHLSLSGHASPPEGGQRAGSGLSRGVRP